MRRNGISFTLTIVVAGVILLMTALSIITLGGSSISQFFQTVGGEQEEQVRDADIREACNQLKQEINTNYCDRYVKTAEYSDCNGFTQPQTDDYMNETGDSQGNLPSHCSQADQWTEITGTGRCSADAVRSSRQVKSAGAAGSGAYEETASEAQCNWNNNYFGLGQGPVVEVQGNEYNCVEEGYITSETCPAE
ncbi:MAG: hypothetical protein ABEI97_02335 [Candidatus Nanohaloarchaea archaeon]